MEADGKAKVSRDPAISWPERCRNAFGQICPVSGPPIATRCRSQDENPTGPAVPPNLALRPSRIRSSSAGVVAAVCRGCSRHETANGSRRLGASMGTPWRQRIQAGRGPEWPRRQRCRFLLVGNNGEWLSWSVSAPSLVSSRAPRCGIKPPSGGVRSWLCQFPGPAGSRTVVRPLGHGKLQPTPPRAG